MESCYLMVGFVKSKTVHLTRSSTGYPPADFNNLFFMEATCTADLTERSLELSDFHLIKSSLCATTKGTISFLDPSIT